MNNTIKLNESQLRKVVSETVKKVLNEFYGGSKKEKVAYENACDCLKYGYGFKFWFERNSQYLDDDEEFAKKVWIQAKEDLGNA